jgi:hypothetical protein
MALTCGTSTWLEAVELINDNEANIVINSDNITDLQTRVTTLEQLHEAGWIKVGPIDDIPDTWTTIMELNMDNVKQGIYSMAASILYTYSSTSSSAELRLTINGTVYNFTREPKDSTDTETGVLILPLDMSTGGDISILVEAQKESGGPTFNVIEANIICNKIL